jgi:hypothetical protein
MVCEGERVFVGKRKRKRKRWMMRKRLGVIEEESMMMGKNRWWWKITMRVGGIRLRVKIFDKNNHTLRM